MKVLHVISSLDARSGGTSEACAGMAITQAQQGLDVRILATARADEDSTVVAKLATLIGSERVIQIGPARGPLARHQGLQSAVERAVNAADIVHLHGVWEEIQYLAAKRAAATRTPFVWAPHGMLDPWSLSQGRLKKRIYWFWRWRHLNRRAAAIHFITRSEARLAAPLFDPQTPTIIEPLGTDSIESEGGQHEGNRLLFSFRLHPKKNVECLIRACARLGNAFRSLSIAGSGDATYLSQLQELAAELGIGDRVVFPGDLRGHQKSEAFREAAVFCLPSHQENFGIVVIEALAAGLPVILSPAVGLAEDLQNEGQVSVVDDDPAAWARRIAEILEDKGLRSRAASRGPELVCERFSWDAIGRNWAEHYHRLKNDES